VLWRCLQIPLALNAGLARLRERLSQYQPIEDDDPSLLWAAVALIITPEPDNILLIRRAERTGDPWGGHMALPGGRREPADLDLLTTAIRETREEIGVDLRPEHLAGMLADVIPRIPVLPPVAVRPFVFQLSARPELSPNQEVSRVRWVTLEHLVRTEIHHPVRLEVGGQERLVMAYELDDAIVWGMTERILTSFLQQLTAVP
jgi:8-oxo-dGTP pyrophosphatase MutT (NUDIX family)